MEGLPTTLNKTYARSLEEIDEKICDYAHRLFQCVAAASQPLRVEELTEFLAFDFKPDAGSTATFLADLSSDDPVNEVLSICSSLLAVVDVPGFRVVQFTHFSVKEYLTSEWLAKTKDSISRFHVSMTPAHTIMAQACLGILLHLDENITSNDLLNFPLAEYAAKHWVDHARFKNVSSTIQDGMKRLFDQNKCHLSIWVWIYDPEPLGRRSDRSQRPTEAQATPLHYAAVHNMHDIATFLIAEHPQDIDALAFDREETPLHVSSRRGHVEIARVLLEHGAEKEARDKGKWSPLERASKEGHVELVQILLEYGADANSRDTKGRTPLYLASGWGKPAVVRALLKHGAEVNARDMANNTALHRAKVEEVAQILIEHGADATALEGWKRTPLHLASEGGRVGVARVLLEHGADANARDANYATPLHLASGPKLESLVGRCLDVARLLLQYSPDINARDDEGKTPLMRATEKNHHTIMQLLLEHGANGHDGWMGVAFRPRTLAEVSYT